MDFIRSTSKKMNLWPVEHFFPPFFSRSALIWKKSGDKSVQLVRGSFLSKYFLQNPYIKVFKPEMCPIGPHVLTLRPLLIFYNRSTWALELYSNLVSNQFEILPSKHLLQIHSCWIMEREISAREIRTSIKAARAFMTALKSDEWPCFGT